MRSGLGILLNSSLSVTCSAEAPRIIGREGGFLRLDSLDLSHVSRQFCTVRKYVWSVIGQWTVHRFPTSLIRREAVFGGVRSGNVIP